MKKKLYEKLILMLKRIFVMMAVILFISSCGDGIVTPQSDTSLILIIASEYLPNEFEARAGDVIFFQNRDSVTYQILSQSSENAFDDAGFFDSSLIPAGTTGSITIPEDAVVGDIFYFYDQFYEDTMITPNGVITIVE